MMMRVVVVVAAAAVMMTMMMIALPCIWFPCVCSAAPAACNEVHHHWQ
jgi:hypothetical protein